jgi:hypothetical protein
MQAKHASHHLVRARFSLVGAWKCLCYMALELGQNSNELRRIVERVSHNGGR